MCGGGISLGLPRRGRLCQVGVRLLLCLHIRNDEGNKPSRKTERRRGASGICCFKMVGLPPGSSWWLCWHPSGMVRVEGPLKSLSCSRGDLSYHTRGIAPCK